VDANVDLLIVSLLPGVSPRAVRDLAARAPLRDVLATPEEHEDLLGPKALEALRGGGARREAEAQLSQAERAGARVVGWDDPEYPALLRRTYDPPPVLYVKGRLTDEDASRSIAIVGARAASVQGGALARRLAADLAAAGATIVAGLARGIDTAAHRGALDVGGRTVAVLGSGLDSVYPHENAPLAAAVAERGALISEFPFGTGPRSGHFPRRNRIIAGWSRAVVVVEAGERSGALITARLALDEGREVLAVPGHPSSPGAAGTNQLIRDGAVLVRNAEDVAQEIDLVMPTATAEGSGDDVVLAALRRDAPSSVEELEERSGRPASELLARLAQLELDDRVRRLPGTLFIRN
jgi:DNA processing protein